MSMREVCECASLLVVCDGYFLLDEVRALLRISRVEPLRMKVPLMLGRRGD